MMKSSSLFLLSTAFVVCSVVQGFSANTPTPKHHPNQNHVPEQQQPTSSSSSLHRRGFFVDASSFLTSSAAAMAFMTTTTTTTAAVTTLSFPRSASASGGATAGKYTTIPIAKRRYYGRVQEAVHEFLAMGPAMVNQGDTTAADVQHFFDPNGAVIVASKKKDVNGQCTKKDNDCRGKEIRDSRYNDMKASMYLLGNAFRINQQKAPDNLPTVRAAKAFFKEVDSLEKLAKANPKKQDVKAQTTFLKALDILDVYLDLVELPPTDSGHYDQEFDTLVGVSSRIT